MKKFSKLLVFLLLLAVVGVLVGMPVSAQREGQYDVLTEGILSEYYCVDKQRGYLTGIAPGTTPEKLLAACAPYGVTTGEKVTTGTKLTYTKDDQVVFLTAIVTGDVNGDGGITISDMLMLKASVLGETLSATATAAGDLNGDGKATISDFLKVKAYLLGLEEVNARSGAGNLLLLEPGKSATWTREEAHTYITGNSDLFTVDGDGVITAKNTQGTAFAYALSWDGKVLDRQMVTVLNEPLSISLGAERCTLAMGQTYTLSPSYNHPVNPNVAWATSDPSVVTVENGVLSGVKFGVATVTASLENGMTAELEVTVAPPITDIAIERTLYKVKPGNSKKLNLLLTPAESGEEILWTTSDPAIATVSSDGTVTGVTYGTVTVTATGKYSGLSATCQVKICDVIQVALTFDDGPNSTTTKLLDYLNKNDIRVTFFLVGNRINSFQNVVKREVAEGHEIAYHSYAHATQTSLSDWQITNDFEKTDKILYDLTGAHFTLWRTPGGAFNTRVLNAVPLPHIMWSVDTLDWKTRNAYSVYTAILQAKDGDIVLLHDLHGTTVEGAIMALEQMNKGDYEFLTVTEMLSRDGTPPENSKNYYSGR